MSFAIPAELADLLQPGTRLRVFYSEKSPNNEIRHIRAVVDDDLVVYRVWSKQNQGWHYQLAGIYAFVLLWQAGQLSRS